MEKFIRTVKSLVDPKELKNFVSSQEDFLSTQPPSELFTALAHFDPSVQSLGCLYLLGALAQQTLENKNVFLLQAIKFIQQCLPVQIRLAVQKFAFVCRRLCDFAIELKQPIRAIQPLKIAIGKLQPTPDNLTPIHADLIQVALLSKCYNSVLSIIDQDLLEVDPATTGLTPKDMLRYQYYAGMVYIGLKQFNKALDMFKLTFAVPAVVLSSIVLESYKKFILVSLLVNGQVESLPKYVSPVIQRQTKPIAPAYQELANAFSTNNTDEVHKVATTHAETFQKDKNFGLVKQVITSLYRRNIQRHTQTYMTLSLSGIASSVKLENAKVAEKYVLRMIEKGEVHASINQPDGMVSFHEDPEQYATNEVLTELDGHIHKVMEISQRLKTLDEFVSSNQYYLQKMISHEKPARFDTGFEDLADLEKPLGFRSK